MFAGLLRWLRKSHQPLTVPQPSQDSSAPWVMFPLGETYGWEATADWSRVVSCSLADYREYLREVPRPTETQIEAFVLHVSSAHSWYKKLPLMPPGIPFVFYLDPTAGRMRTFKRGGEVAVAELTEKDRRDHYSRRTTAVYLGSFGHLAYSDVYPASTDANSDGRLSLPDILPVFFSHSAAWRVPREVAEAGMAGVTAAIHPSAQMASIFMHRDIGHPLAAWQRRPLPDDPPHVRRIREICDADTGRFRTAFDGDELKNLIQIERTRVQAEMAQTIRRMLALVYDEASTNPGFHPAPPS